MSGLFYFCLNFRAAKFALLRSFLCAEIKSDKNKKVTPPLRSGLSRSVAIHVRVFLLDSLTAFTRVAFAA